MLPYSKNLKGPSRTLRKEMTDAEQVLWSHLRRKQVLGIQFYRQKPIGPYIADFYAPAVKLIIEADGSQHMEKEQREYDAVREAFLKTNTETEAVMEEIFRVCPERQIPLNPPFSKGDF